MSTKHEKGRGLRPRPGGTESNRVQRADQGQGQERPGQVKQGAQNLGAHAQTSAVMWNAPGRKPPAGGYSHVPHPERLSSAKSSSAPISADMSNAPASSRSSSIVGQKSTPRGTNL